MGAAVLINHSRALSTSEVGLNFGRDAGSTGAFGPGWWLQPGLKGVHWYRFVAPTGTNAPFSPSWCLQPGPKASFQQPKGRETETFGPGWCRKPGQKRRIGPGWCHQPVPMHPFSPGPSQQPGLKALPRCGGKFSPTSLVEGEQHQFISPAASLLSNSSKLQA